MADDTLADELEQLAQDMERKDYDYMHTHPETVRRAAAALRKPERHLDDGAKPCERCGEAIAKVCLSCNLDDRNSALRKPPVDREKLREKIAELCEREAVIIAGTSFEAIQQVARNHLNAYHKVLALLEGEGLL